MTARAYWTGGTSAVVVLLTILAAFPSFADEQLAQATDVKEELKEIEGRPAKDEPDAQESTQGSDREEWNKTIIELQKRAADAEKPRTTYDRNVQSFAPRPGFRPVMAGPHPLAVGRYQVVNLSNNSTTHFVMIDTVTGQCWERTSNIWNKLGTAPGLPAPEESGDAERPTSRGAPDEQARMRLRQLQESHQRLKEESQRLQRSMQDMLRQLEQQNQLIDQRFFEATPLERR